MPNIPPLASNVVKSEYTAAIVLLTLFALAVAYIPHIHAVLSAIAGWQVGTWIYPLTQRYKNYWAKREQTATNTKVS